MFTAETLRTPRKKRIILRGLCLVASVSWSYYSWAAPQSPEAARAFEVLRTNCLACHDQKLRSGKLVMETAADLLKGGAHGPALVPGKSAESRLIKMITGEIIPKMPLEGELKPEEVDVLRKWIDAGAPAWVAGGTEPESLSVPEIKPTVGVKAQVSSLAFSFDGQSLAVAGYREVHLVDPQSLKPRKTLQGPSDLVRALAYSPDGKTLAAAGGGPSRYGEIILWDVSSGQLLRKLRGHADYIYGIAFSPDGKILASSSYDRLIKLWNVATGAELKTLKEHTDAVFPVAFSPDGKRLASGGADRTVKIWDVETGRRLYTLSDSTDIVFTLAFHPSGQKISASGADKHIRTWALGKDSGTLSQVIIAHESEVTKILYLPGGKQLVSASADRSVKVWNMEKGEVLTVLERQPDWVLDMTVTSDGQFLALGRYDGSIGIYRTEHMEKAAQQNDE